MLWLHQMLNTSAVHPNLPPFHQPVHHPNCSVASHINHILLLPPAHKMCHSSAILPSQFPKTNLYYYYFKVTLLFGYLIWILFGNKLLINKFLYFEIKCCRDQTYRFLNWSLSLVRAPNLDCRNCICCSIEWSNITILLNYLSTVRLAHLPSLASPAYIDGSHAVVV